MTPMTRDNFNPVLVLESMRDGGFSYVVTKRLLEEACHALARLQHEHYTMVNAIRDAVSEH